MPVLKSRRKKGRERPVEPAPNLRPLPEREPVRQAIHDFRNRMEWSQDRMAEKLDVSLQSVQKYEQPVPPYVLNYCIELCEKMGWHDLSYMLGSNRKLSDADEPTDPEMHLAERVILLKRRLSKDLLAQLDSDLSYYERKARRQKG